MDWLSDPNAWIGLLTLTVLEIVLGIDNIIFISILAGKLPRPQQPKARRLGLMGAFVTRILLLLSIAITFFDGFDMNVIAYTAPYLAESFDLDRIQLGNLFSAGTFGTINSIRVGETEINCAC